MLEDMGTLIANRGEDPNVPIEGYSKLISFGTYGDAIPFHNICLFRVLPKVLAYEAGNKNGMKSSVAKIDLEKLYSFVKKCLHELFPKVLGLNYYEAEEATTEQWWVSTPGQETLVADPIQIQQLQNYCSRLRRRTRPTISDRSIAQSSKDWIFDVFETLPLETMIDILNNWSSVSLKEFHAATPAAVRALACECSWKRRIKADMPWMWDLPLDQALPCTETDWQQVYSDLDRRNTYRASDAVLGLVNRRRIWKVCPQLAVMYAGEVNAPMRSPSIPKVSLEAYKSIVFLLTLRWSSRPLRMHSDTS